MQALRKKYLYHPQHSLRIDLNESGFPNFLEMNYLQVDLLSRDERLKQLPPAAMLRQNILDYMMKYHTEPQDLLWKLSERSYYESLEADKLFLPFTPGRLELLADGPNVRSYIFSWGCFDFKTNRPYMHILTFDQSASDLSLHRKAANFDRFIEVIKSEGSRVPDLGLLALAIDNELENIHPKVLKRICIGPLHSGQTCVISDGLCRVLSEHSRSEQDFILLMKDEVVFSVRQEELSGGVFSPKKVRQIFHFPESDLELYDAKVSTIHRYMLIPHHVLQHMEGGSDLDEYKRYQKLPFDQQGYVHV